MKKGVGNMIKGKKVGKGVRNAHLSIIGPFCGMSRAFGILLGWRYHMVF